MKHFIVTLFLLAAFATAASAQKTPTTNYSGLNFVVEEEDDEPANVSESVASKQTETTEETVSKETAKTETTVKEEEKKPQSEPQKEPETTVKKGEKKKQSEQPKEEEITEEEEEQEEEKDKKIYLAMSNVDSTLAAVRVVSYCSGDFAIYNDTKKNLQELSGTIGFGDQKKKYKFTDVAPGTSMVWPLQFVGKACESIFNLPDIQVSKCQMERTSDKKCREKLIFVPLNK